MMTSSQHSPSSGSSTPSLLQSSADGIEKLLKIRTFDDRNNNDSKQQLDPFENNDCTFSSIIVDPIQLTNKEIQFLEAARTNDVILVQQLRQEKISANTKNNMCRSALHLAAANGHLEAVKVLLAEKASKDATDTFGMTPLMWAALGGHTEVVQALLAAKASTAIASKQGLTVVHCVVLANQIKVLRLLASIVNVEKLELSKTCLGDHTPLHLASERGFSKMVAELMKIRIDIMKKNKIGQTALHVAAEGGHCDVIKLLLARPEMEVDNTDLDGASALLLASAAGHADAADYLLQTSLVNVDLADKKGMTSLMHAAKNGHDSVVALLLDHNCNADLQDEVKNTALHLAVGRGHLYVIMLLVRAKCDVTLVNNVKQTALHLAVELGNPDTVRMLLSADGIQLKARDGNGKTPLALAARADYPAIVDMIIIHDRLKMLKKLMQEKVSGDIHEYVFQTPTVDDTRNPLFEDVIVQETLSSQTEETVDDQIDEIFSNQLSALGDIADVNYTEEVVFYQLPQQIEQQPDFEDLMQLADRINRHYSADDYVDDSESRETVGDRESFPIVEISVKGGVCMVRETIGEDSHVNVFNGRRKYSEETITTTIPPRTELPLRDIPPDVNDESTFVDIHNADASSVERSSFDDNVDSIASTKSVCRMYDNMSQVHDDFSDVPVAASADGDTIRDNSEVNSMLPDELTPNDDVSVFDVVGDVNSMGQRYADTNDESRVSLSSVHQVATGEYDENVDSISSVRQGASDDLSRVDYVSDVVAPSQGETDQLTADDDQLADSGSISRSNENGFNEQLSDERFDYRSSEIERSDSRSTYLSSASHDDHQRLQASRDRHRRPDDDETEAVREMTSLLWKLAVKQLKPDDWKALAKYWKFTGEHINAVQLQYTGSHSYRTHGYRLLKIWLQCQQQIARLGTNSGLQSDGGSVSLLGQLFEALAAIGRRKVAEDVRRQCNKKALEKRNKLSCVVI